MNLQTRTRLKITITGLLFCMAMGAYAVYQKMDGVASTALAGVLTIVTAYGYSETKRPSNS